MIRQYEYNDLPDSFFEVDITSCDAQVSSRVAEIIADVRQRGDAAVLDYTQRFDGVRPESLTVSESEWARALKSVDAGFLAIMREAAENIYNFHKRQISEGFEIKRPDGAVLGQRVTPIERVGIYIPGGTAQYPSTVLMNAIPAKIAGVKSLSLATPPGKDGKISSVVLAAADITGVDIIYKCGGAQAVAALAYGTQSINQVYKITGPGNIYVAEAKRQVFGAVDIDMIAGPSDVLIVAGEKAEPPLIAADMLAQAEHDIHARAILVTPDRALAGAVIEELGARLEKLPRKEIAGASIRKNGAVIIVSDLAQAMECANRIAPEHLELCVEEPFSLLELVQNAGSVFLGNNSPEALGDYFAGPNHTLPTMGTARFNSPLSVDDFVKRSSYTCFPREALSSVAAKVAAFARHEGLEAHAASALARFEKEEG